MNIHVPQSLESQAELRLLSSTKNYIVSAQASKPNIAIVQDSLLGAFLMTKGCNKISKERFFDICMRGFGNDGKSWSSEYILKKLDLIKSVFKEKGKKTNVFIGKSLFSLLLPDDFIYTKKNDADKDEPIVKIYRGILYEGAMNKAILGASHNSIIQVLNKEYGSDIASCFVDNIQFITNAFLEMNGFSIGIEDCIATKNEEIEGVIQKCFAEAKSVEENTYHPGIREMRISAALSKAKDIGLKIAKDALSPNNSFVQTVTSGSKGDFFNIAQITGLLGQQNITGKRIELMLNQGRRSLPHYPFSNLTTELEYESRGFVRHSFIHGLNPKEFYFHAMSGREGVTDTAMGTSKSGYIQRRIVKCLEDLQIQYDGTVRNTSGSIYQIAYGEDGMDASKTVKVKDDIEVCDIGRMVDKLNLQYELKNNMFEDLISNLNTINKTTYIPEIVPDVVKEVVKETIPEIVAEIVKEKKSKKEVVKEVVKETIPEIVTAVVKEKKSKKEVVKETIPEIEHAVVKEKKSKKEVIPEVVLGVVPEIVTAVVKEKKSKKEVVKEKKK